LNGFGIAAAAVIGVAGSDDVAAIRVKEKSVRIMRS
jgi:hypothetical protein